MYACQCRASSPKGLNTANATTMNVVLMIRVVNVSLRPLFIRDAQVRNSLVIRHRTLQNIPEIWNNQLISVILQHQTKQ